MSEWHKPQPPDVREKDLIFSPLVQIVEISSLIRSLIELGRSGDREMPPKPRIK
jgi:hypothetical protein